MHIYASLLVQIIAGRLFGDILTKNRRTFNPENWIENTIRKFCLGVNVFMIMLPLSSIPILCQCTFLPRLNHASMRWMAWFFYVPH